MGCNQRHLKAALPKRRFYFIKPLIGNFGDRLRIPPAFVKKHMKHIHCNQVTLENADRRHWHVTLEITNDGVFFQNGWKKFLEDNSLQIGEILLFRYIVDSHFTVQMFDRTCCEKERFFCRTNHEEPNKEAEKKMEVRQTKIQNHHVHQCRACTAKIEGKRERPCASKNVHSTQKMDGIVKEGQMVNKSSACVKDYLFGSPNGKGTNKKNQKMGQLKDQELQNQDDIHYIVRTTRSAKKRKWTCSSINAHLTGKKPMIVKPSDKKVSNPIFSEFSVEQENQEQELLKEETTRKENAREQHRKKPVKGVHRPSFRLVMTRSTTVGFKLRIPVKVRKDYFPQKRREITLHHPSGRTWLVKYLEKGYLCAGWNRFSTENNLKKGDTCVFQLGDQNFAFDIRIIRVVNKSKQMSIQMDEQLRFLLSHKSFDIDIHDFAIVGGSFQFCLDLF